MNLAVAAADSGVAMRFGAVGSMTDTQLFPSFLERAILFDANPEACCRDPDATVGANHGVFSCVAGCGHTVGNVSLGSSSVNWGVGSMRCAAVSTQALVSQLASQMASVANVVRALWALVAVVSWFLLSGMALTVARQGC